MQCPHSCLHCNGQMDSNWQSFTSWSPASQANMAVVQGGNLCRTACQLHEHVAVVNCTRCNRTQTLKQSCRIAHLSQAWRLLWLLVTRCLAVKLCESSTAVSTRVHPTVMKVGCRMSQICHTGLNHTAKLESEGMWDGKQRLYYVRLQHAIYLSSGPASPCKIHR